MTYNPTRAFELLRRGTQNPGAEFRDGQEDAIRHVVENRGRLLLVQCELGEARTDSEVAALLGVGKSQAREWLIRAVEEGALEKVKKTKPLRYRRVSSLGI